MTTNRYRGIKPLLAVLIWAVMALAAVVALSVVWENPVRAQSPANGAATIPAQPSKGDDVLGGTKGPDRIRALAGDDVIYGHAGDDRLWGNAGDDRLRGGRGDDLIWGNAGHDRLSGGPGDDRLITTYDSTRDFVSCGDGQDTAFAHPEDVVADDCETVSGE